MSVSDPPVNARAATWAVLRSPSAILVAVALPAWTLIWALPDWLDGDRAGATVTIVTSLAVVGSLLHGMVRRERGFSTSAHRAAPLVVGLGMIGCYLVVNAVDPIVSTGQMLLSTVGIVVILAAFGEGERWYRARQARQARQARSAA